jgi:ketosteroid isomerase-like protein
MTRSCPATTHGGLPIVEALGAAVGRGDPAEVPRHLALDVACTAGAGAPLPGVEAPLAVIAEHGRLVRWDGHTPRGVWLAADALVVEVESHFTRLMDGRAISLPCTDIDRFRDGRIADWRVYADMSPIHD